MPTITVEGSPIPTEVRRAVARKLSLWLRTQGVDINHVITRFRPADPAGVFSGPFPLADSGAFAFVRCTVGAHRTADFRRGLSTQLVRTLSPAVPAGRIFIQFEQVDPGLHINGADIIEEQ